MPIEIDLGGLTVVVEAFIGHTDTDLIYRVPVAKRDLHRRLAHRRTIPGQHQRLPDAVARDARQVRDLRQEHALRPGPRPDYAARKASRKCARALTTSPNTRKNPTRPASPWKMPSNGTSSPTSTKTIAVLLGLRHRPHLRTALRRVVRQAGSNSELFLVIHLETKRSHSVPKCTGSSGHYKTVAKVRVWFCRGRPFFGRAAFRFLG